MSCILNLNRFLIPNDVIAGLTSIYKYIGKNEVYESKVGNDLDRIINQTIERDSYFLAKLIKLEISDSRMRLIITKDSAPRNKDEATLYGIKDILKTFHMNPQGIGTQSNDLINMINYIHPNQNIKYDYDEIDKKAILKSQSMRSKRLIVDEINNEVTKSIQKADFDPIVLYLHYFIDIYNLKPFMSKNEEAAYLLLYLLLLKAEVFSFRFVSLFEIIYNNFEEFDTELKNASYLWKEGYPQTLSFIRFMVKLINTSYQKTNDLIKEYEFDSNINKSNNIENTISKLPEIFTKDEIRIVHPYISESTINRTLSKLRAEKYIKPLGKGRSAKWIKIKNMNL